LKLQIVREKYVFVVKNNVHDGKKINFYLIQIKMPSPRKRKNIFPRKLKKKSRKPVKKKSRKPVKKKSRKPKKFRMKKSEEKMMKGKYKLNTCITRCEKCDEDDKDCFFTLDACEKQLVKGFGRTGPTAKTMLEWKYQKFKTEIDKINQIRIPLVQKKILHSHGMYPRTIDEITGILKRMFEEPWDRYHASSKRDLDIVLRNFRYGNGLPGLWGGRKAAPQPLVKFFKLAYPHLEKLVSDPATTIRKEHSTKLEKLLKGADLPCLDLKVLFSTYDTLQPSFNPNKLVLVSTPRSKSSQLPNLSFLDLSGARFPQANFSGIWDHETGEITEETLIMFSNLKKVDFQGADLRATNFIGSYLQNANLQGASLRDSNLSDTDLRGANLQGAILTSANLDSSDLRGADFRGAEFGDDTTFDEDTMIEGAKFRLDEGQFFPKSWALSKVGGLIRQRDVEAELRQRGAIIET